MKTKNLLIAAGIAIALGVAYYFLADAKKPVKKTSEKPVEA